MSLTLLLLVALLPLAWLLGQPLWQRWRRLHRRRQPVPKLWRTVLRKRVPLTRRLPGQLRRRLLEHIQVFLAEKPFIACAGMVIDDEVRVTIAAHACLLTLNQPDPFYPQLRQILVYPDSFRVRRQPQDEAGVVHAQDQVLAGESWREGQVVLSWVDVLESAGQSHDGRNVAIHEFAHQLDQADGDANGAPALPDPSQQARWAEVWAAEFQALRARVAWGKPSLFDAYGLTHAGEFFAVVSEVFFERGADLARQHPDLHEQLVRYYRIDPGQWR